MEKHKIQFCLLGILLIPLIFFIPCKAQNVSFKISDNPNPWPDDYTSISSMENYKLWGTYNVHDPYCLKVGDTYYMYSTDAIFRENRIKAKEKNINIGYIQVRKSKDLVHWDFVGWAFPEIPVAAVEHIHKNNNNKGGTNIWAPYIVRYGNVFRLYYCVSAFGKSISYLGMAESNSPEGPWIQKGPVIKTTSHSPMNAIDPTVVTNPDNGEQWMIYGSYFGGIYCVQLNPETGFTMKKEDFGHNVARRFNGMKNNIEAPEVIYNPQEKKYYLFVSYDPLMTTYNVRVGRSDKPEGPYFDKFGINLSQESDKYPIITHPYRFQNHSGWAGTGHCGVLRDGNHYFMFHQARLAPENQLMVLNVRELFWTEDGWPVASPERYAGSQNSFQFTSNDLVGDWEIILIRDSKYERKLWAGQILWGESELKEDEVNISLKYTFTNDGKMVGEQNGAWSLSGVNKLSFKVGDEEVSDLTLFIGQDWENQKRTILFTGLDKYGFSVWGKRIK